MKAGWEIRPFDEVVSEESGGNLKTPQSEFLKEGEFAVVDQGKELIAGYVNDRERLCRSSLPVVIFGDHTRCFKFVDFPFCMGADGIKVLRPKLGADGKYLFHFLRQLRLPDGGYDRHFKYLKRTEVPLPPLAEQRRIAEVLDRAEALRAKRRAALAQLDSFTQSIFLDLFGDPVRNEKTWPTTKVCELCLLVRGSSPRPQGDPRFFGGPVPRLMVADITRDGWLVTPSIDSLTEEGAKRSRPVAAGTVVMAVSGNVGLVSRLAIDACVHDGFVAFTGLNELRCLPEFLLALLHYSKSLHDKHKAGAIFINLTTTDIKSMPLSLPPIALQREFARRVAAVERVRTAQQAALSEVDALFASLQHRAFCGEL